MVTIEQLEDWLKTSERKELELKIEEYVDKTIQNEVINGKTTVLVKTGFWGKTRSERTPFYDLYCNKDISEENLLIVRKNVIKKYEENGFKLEEVFIDTGYNNSAIALEFRDLDKMVEELHIDVEPVIEGNA